jgi:hypothetical protein
MKETDLYKPLKKHLEKAGYTVRAEVHGCDLTAVKDGEVVIVELKTSFNLKLVYQAMTRQRLSDSIYVAVPKPKTSLFRSPWKEALHLLKRLEIGLIFLKPAAGKDMSVEIAFHPVPFNRKKNYKKKRALLKEIEARSGDYNLGGSTRTKLMTAYRENSVFIAVCLESLGPSSPAVLKRLGTGEKTQSILYANFYGWFTRIDTGTYIRSDKRKAAVKKYPKLVKTYQKAIADRNR